MSDHLHLLLIEDLESDAELVLREFRRSGMTITHRRIQREPELREALAAESWDAIICDFSLPGFGAGAALEIVRASGKDLPFILVSGSIPDQSAVEMMRHGANDYILKDNLSRLAPATQREIKEAAERRDRRRAEVELAQSRAIYQSLVDTLPAAVFRLDARGAFVFVNAQFCAARGCSAAEILGTTVFEPADPAFSGRMVDSDRLVLGTGQVHQQEDTIRAPDQPPRHITIVKAPVRDPGGKISGVQGFYWDITDRRAAEEARLEAESQLRQMQKMEAIGQLSGGVAHDFNNILTVIKGNAALLETDPLLPEELRSHVSDITRASQRAARLTSQLLAFSRRQAMQTTIVNLNDSITNLTKMLQRMLGENIVMRLHFNAVPPCVQADVSMIDQVLLNLVVNAKDAMPNGGHIDIETRIEEIGPQAASRNPDARPGWFVRLTVRDTGCGMSPEVLGHIFEPFYTTKDVGKGTGLGLAVVYGIVRQHKGWIEVTSQEAQGTQFDLYLPHSPNSSPPVDPHEVDQRVRHGHEGILVVEDEPTVRQLIRIVLSRMGYEVHEASNGAAALDLWPGIKHRVSLVLTDMVMPDLVNGRELAERLRKDRPDLPVLFMSGYSTEHPGPEFFLHEGSNFVSKPFTPGEITAAIRKLLDR